MDHAIWDFLDKAITVIAAAAAAYLYYRRRKPFPRADIEHTIVRSEALGDGSTYFRLNIHIENIGDVLIQLRSIRVYIYQASPLPDNLPTPYLSDELEFELPCLAVRKAFLGVRDGRHIEPGECEELQIDLVVSGVAAIYAYSHLQNASLRSWRHRLRTLRSWRLPRRACSRCHLNRQAWCRKWHHQRRKMIAAWRRQEHRIGWQKMSTHELEVKEKVDGRQTDK